MKAHRDARLAVIALVIAAAGCTDGPTERVQVVAVQCESRGGAPDCRTVVQFPDSTRRIKSDRWGEVGDVFHARKATAGSWR
jgi:hypothetical protein